MRRGSEAETNLDTPELLAQQNRGENLSQVDNTNLDVLKRERDKTKKNIRYMLEHWLGSDYNIPLNKTLLIELFRHGVAHQFFPKAAGISKSPEGTPLIEIRMANGFPVPTLNENRLRCDFLSALELIEEIIEHEDNCGLQRAIGNDGTVQDLVNRMNAKLDVLLLLDKSGLLKILDSHAPQYLPQVGHIQPADSATTPDGDQGPPATISGTEIPARS
jgi:hypothetical protein